MAEMLYTIKTGDTLTSIATEYGVSVENLMGWNNIKNADVIYAGDVIYVYKDQSAETSSVTVNSNAPVIRRFGLMNGTDRMLYVSWAWAKPNLDHYEVYWRYSIGNNVAIDAGSTTVKETNGCTYTAPEEAVYVACEVLPVAKTYTSNDKEVPYWTAQRSTTVRYYFKDNPPGTPEDPKLELKNLILSGYIDNIDKTKLNANGIQFQIFSDDARVYKNIDVMISNLRAAFSCAVPAGHRYKVRCRAFRDDRKGSVIGSINNGQLTVTSRTNTGSVVYGEWTKFSDNIGTPPVAISGITSIRATSETSVYLEWSASETATKYDIEYTTKKEYFDGSDQTTTINDVKFTHYEKTGLETGTEYFFRVRACNDDGESPWSEPKSVVIGTDPAAPTTWSSTTTAIVGEQLNLYWVHNAEDGSSQTYAELEIKIGDTVETQTIKNSEDEEEKDKTSVYSIDTTAYPEGTKIYWRVRTAGVTLNYGEWSVQRVVDIYASPTLELSVTDIDGNQLDTITSFPFYTRALAGPSTQAPIGYHVTVLSNQIYTTVDSIGNEKIVNIGEALYSKYFDITDPLVIEFSANNINLEQNMSYTLTCIAVMNSGLTVESSVSFLVTWTDMQYWPNAEVAIDNETLAAYIHPHCYNYTTNYYKVSLDSGSYILTTETIDPPDNHVSSGNVTTTGEEVYSVETASGEVIYYAISESSELVEDVTLSVYRREFDGTFTEIETGISNLTNTFVTDPHPALDYARYRIVATTNSTGAVSFYDMPGVVVDEKAVIIQWDEEWSNFDSVGEEKLAEPTWSGSMLKLPYNIDVSDKRSPDVELVEYIGRSNPVSYYGTQIGESQSWSVEIDKTDKETLYAIRRLARWMGDVYVREPSGSGYWANIVVSFSQKHLDLTIPVTFDIVRVEGGV